MPGEKARKEKTLTNARKTDLFSDLASLDPAGREIVKALIKGLKK
jgi:hypothetical protein